MGRQTGHGHNTSSPLESKLKGKTIQLFCVGSFRIGFMSILGWLVQQMVPECPFWEGSGSEGGTGAVLQLQLTWMLFLHALDKSLGSTAVPAHLDAIPACSGQIPEEQQLQLLWMPFLHVLGKSPGSTAAPAHLDAIPAGFGLIPGELQLWWLQTPGDTVRLSSGRAGRGHRLWHLQPCRDTGTALPWAPPGLGDSGSVSPARRGCGDSRARWMGTFPCTLQGGMRTQG